jgi:nitroreductase
MFKQMVRKSIHKSQHCNRNWDLTKDIPQEDIDLITEAATQCPVKQNLNYYKTHVITDRAVIQKLHDATTIMDFGDAPDFKGYDGIEGYKDGTGPTNSQIMANLVIAFTKDEPEYIREPREMEDQDGGEALTYKEDRQQAVGIAAGYVNLVSTMLGYSTGCCKCFWDEKITEALGVDGKDPILLMGIGIPDPTKQRQQHHVDSSFRFGSHKNMREAYTHF